MRAVVHDRYGPPDVLQIEQVARPAPKDGEVLVKVFATTVTRTGCHRRAASQSCGGCTRAQCGRGGRSEAASSPGRSRRPARR